MREQERIDRVMPGWMLREKIGEGAYGEVWRVESRAEGAESALKIIRIPHDESERCSLFGTGMNREEIGALLEEMAGGCLGEISTMQELSDCPYVVKIQDCAVQRDPGGEQITVYIRMELLEGLDRYLYRKKRRVLSHEEAIRMGIQICQALEACERKHILHRDIKPSNILVSADGDFRLGDFGIARRVESVTETTLSQRGTPRYMAPEMRSGHYGMSANVYALGLVLYQYFNHGRLPFEPAWPAQLSPMDRELAAQRRMSGETIPMPDDADELVGNAILMALSPDPQRRWRSPRAFRTALQTLAARWDAEEEPSEEGGESHAVREEEPSPEDASARAAEPEKEEPAGDGAVPESSVIGEEADSGASVVEEEADSEAPVMEEPAGKKRFLYGKKKWLLLLWAALVVALLVALRICSDRARAVSSYIISYDVNGGRGLIKSEEWDEENLKNFYVADDGITRDGYALCGWSFNRGKKARVVLPPQAQAGKVSLPDFSSHADHNGRVTLYAVWEKVEGAKGISLDKWMKKNLTFQSDDGDKAKGTAAYVLLINHTGSDRRITVHYSFLDRSGREVVRHDDEIPCVTAGARVPSWVYAERSDVAGIRISVTTDMPKETWPADMQMSVKGVEKNTITYTVTNTGDEDTPEGARIHLLDCSSLETRTAMAEVPVLSPGESREVKVTPGSADIEQGLVYEVVY